MKSKDTTEELYQSHYEDLEREFLIIDTNVQLTQGVMYVVEMSFEGPLVSDLAGLYLSSYSRGNDTM